MTHPASCGGPERPDLEWAAGADPEKGEVHREHHRVARYALSLELRAEKAEKALSVERGLRMGVEGELATITKWYQDADRKAGEGDGTVWVDVHEEDWAKLHLLLFSRPLPARSEVVVAAMALAEADRILNDMGADDDQEEIQEDWRRAMKAYKAALTAQRDEVKGD